MSKIGKFDGQYRFLSNFFKSQIIVDGTIYETVEHYYQSMKAVNMSDWAKVANAKTPGEAKKIGRTIRVRGDWESVKLAVMRRGVFNKFLQHDCLARNLIGTGNTVLQEGNNWGDQFWGVNLETGEGENWLGRILMEVRDLIRTFEAAYHPKYR